VQLTVAAPAKINLGLRILGRRDDGYHLIESLFVPLELEDTLEIDIRSGKPREAGPELVLDVEGDAPAGPSNLVAAATQAFFAATPRAAAETAGVRIVLRKRIPTAAGLGGGSSDAAATLLGLSRLCAGSPPARELARIALTLGADVPYFLDPKPSLVVGIGEQIEPFEGLPPLWLLLANPGIAVATAEVYRLYDALRECSREGLTAAEPGYTMRALSRPGGDSALLAGLAGLRNDLEAAAIRLCPPVSRLRDRMRALGARIVGMSGSGATVYGEFATKAEAEIARTSFEPTIWTHVTRSRAQEPSG
jgi:4-diphosphocytidyl-2-C-methyl-D-erythritol kinase